MNAEHIRWKVAAALGWKDLRWVDNRSTGHTNLVGIEPGSRASQFTGAFPTRTVPEYEVKMDAAWEVVKKVQETGLDFGLFYFRDDDTWNADFEYNGEIDLSNVHFPFNMPKAPPPSKAKTAPMAICLAALTVVDEKAPG